MVWPAALSLRALQPSDDAFMARVYAACKPDFALLGEPLLSLQRQASRRGYLARFPDLQSHLILWEGEPVGFVEVAWTDQALWGVDLGLLPEHRNRSIGAHIISDLQAQAQRAGLPMRLSVLEHNPAARLYARLGFRVEAAEPPYLQMIYP